MAEGAKVGTLYYEVTADISGLLGKQADVDKVLGGLSNRMTDTAKAAKVTAVATGLAEAANAGLAMSAIVAAQTAQAHSDALAAEARALAATEIAAKSAAEAEAARIRTQIAALELANKKIRAEEEAAKKTTQTAHAMSGATISAGELRQATRMLPAQFTDIAVSLQGGQDPLTVFLQQGGQIKDQFGGAGAALRGMAGYIAGLVNPFTVAAAAAGVLAYGFLAGSKESERFAANLALTGNRSGTTADQLIFLSSEMDNLAGVTQRQGAAALNEFISLGVKGEAAIQRFVEAAIRLERDGGQAISQTAKEFKDLEKDPLQAAIKLDERTGFLTLSIYEQAKALTEQGKKVEAATLLQNAYADAIETRTKSINANLGTIERAWRSITSVAREALDAILDIGREESIQQKISDLDKFISNAESLVATGDPRATNRFAMAELQAKKDQRDTLLESLRIAKQVASAQATDRAKVEAAVAGDKDKNKPSGGMRGTEFDSERYLAGLSARVADEWEKINITEAEALRQNAALMAKGSITAAEAEKAKTLIQQNAVAERQELMAKESQSYLAEMSRRYALEKEQAAKNEAEKKQIEENRKKAKTVSIIDPIEAVRNEMANKLAEQDKFRALDLEHEQIYIDAKNAITKRGNEEINALQAGYNVSSLNLMQSMADGALNILEKSGKERTALGKTLFLASKALAIAEILINTEVAAAKAGAQLGIFGLPMAGLIRAQGYASAGMVAGMAVAQASGRQYGGPVSADSLYRVNEKGRPEMFTAANGNQYMMPTSNGRVTAADKIGGDMAWSIVVNNNAAGATASASVDQTSRTVTIAVNEVASQIRTNTGPVWGALRSATNTTSRL